MSDGATQFNHSSKKLSDFDEIFQNKKQSRCGRGILSEILRSENIVVVVK